MEVKRSGARWSWAEFARLPNEGSTRYEVIDGELAVTPSPTPRHQAIVLDLGSMLEGFVQGEGLGRVFPGPVDVLFAEGDYLEPDLVFLSAGRMGLVTDRGIEGPPDLVVEILSPSTAERDRGIKLERYRHFGVPEYWIVDPTRRAVEVWRLGQGVDAAEVYEAGSVLEWSPGPGPEALEVPVGEIFQGSDDLPG